MDDAHGEHGIVMLSLCTAPHLITFLIRRGGFTRQISLAPLRFAETPAGQGLRRAGIETVNYKDVKNEHDARAMKRKWQHQRSKRRSIHDRSPLDACALAASRIGCKRFPFAGAISTSGVETAGISVPSQQVL